MSTAGSTGGGSISSGGAISSGAPASTGGGSTGVSASSAAAFMGWGDNWRSELAKGSTDPEKELKRLERFVDPVAIYGSFRQLEGKMSSGELRTTLSKDATAQEVAAWRSQNGIPAKPEDYKINLGAGKQVPKEDDTFLKTFLKSAHDAHFNQSQVDQAIATFYAEVERQEQALTEAEKKAEAATEDALRKAWGADYRPNKAMAEALLARAPAGFSDKFKNGYLADRTPIKASVEAWQWLVMLEREINPAATVVSGFGSEAGKGIAEELAQYRQWMGAPRDSVDYKKYWGDEKVQERYRQLLEAETKLKAKAA